MMTVADMIADLDDALAEDGTDIVFRQVNKHPMPNVDTACRAHVRDADDKAENGITQVRSAVIMSPTGLSDLPKKLDQIVVGGKVRTVQVPRFKRIDGQIVRIELECEGVPG